MGFEKSKIDPSIFLKFKRKGEKTTRDSFTSVLERKMKSSEGLIGHSLIEYLRPDEVENRELEGFICLHVDD